MMSVFRTALKKTLTAALCLALLLPLSATAFAAETDGGADTGIIDADALQAKVEAYIEEHKLDKDNISIGYCYTATGDTWYYNGDNWYYSASMYKVPLMMILAEREYNGELTQESDINGLSLAKAEESVLVYSNNDFAHLVMAYIGTDLPCRKLYQQYSGLSLREYDQDFYDYSYFSARFMTDVMITLYSEPERFPHITDCLKQAQTDSYFQAGLAGKYEIAQKYGSYKEFNNTTGIIYTPNPFILTVMTENMGVNTPAIADWAVIMEEYTLSLDEKLKKHEQDKTAGEQQAEADRQAAEKAAQEQAEAQRQADEAAKAAQEKAAAEQAAKEARRHKLLVVAVCAAVAVAALGALAAVIVKKRRVGETVGAPARERSGRREAAPPERGRSRDKNGAHYRPRH